MKSRLKQIRKALKLTQAQLSEALMVSKSTIEAYEYGRTQITERSVADICRLYNVNKEWFETGKGNMFNTVTKEQEIGQLVADILKNDPEEIREEFKEIIMEMSDAQLVVLHDFIMETAEKFKSLPKK